MFKHSNLYSALFIVLDFLITLFHPGAAPDDYNEPNPYGDVEFQGESPLDYGYNEMSEGDLPDDL